MKTKISSCHPSPSGITAKNLHDCTYGDLRRILREVTEELERQEAQRQKMRAAWVDRHYDYFICDRASFRCAGDVVVVAVVNRDSTLSMATARPVKGDIYDEKTGIAVAYAKCIGHTIPDFI